MGAQGEQQARTCARSWLLGSGRSRSQPALAARRELLYRWVAALATTMLVYGLTQGIDSNVGASLLSLVVLIAATLVWVGDGAGGPELVDGSVHVGAVLSTMALATSPRAHPPGTRDATLALTRTRDVISPRGAPWPAISRRL